MKRTLHLAPSAFFTVCLAVGMASGTLPTGGAGGAYGSGPQGCPTAMLEGMVSSVDVDNQKFTRISNLIQTSRPSSGLERLY